MLSYSVLSHHVIPWRALVSRIHVLQCCLSSDTHLRTPPNLLNMNKVHSESCPRFAQSSMEGVEKSKVLTEGTR